MVQVHFTENLKRHGAEGSLSVEGATVRQVLEAVFERIPHLRSYLLDDQQGLRTHLVIFVGKQPVKDRLGLSDVVAAGQDVHVFQALSGG